MYYFNQEFLNTAQGEGDGDESDEICFCLDALSTSL